MPMQQAHAHRFLSTTLCAAALLVAGVQSAAAQTLSVNPASSAATGIVNGNASPVVPVPPSELYGVLYRDVELAHLYPDSKTFADMVPNAPPQQIVDDYARQKDDAQFALKSFVAQRFTLPARETKNYVSDPNQSITAHIDTLWSVLRRDPDASASPWSSLLPLPYPYIVPGDRFDEIYYWDSYFIMLGLRQSGREDLLKNELDNFAVLIDRYGHIPNGNRTYYLSRSQPPFFAQMVRLAADREGDQVYLRYLPQLRQEYAYWMDGHDKIAAGSAYRHLVRLPDGTLLNRYWDERATPRRRPVAQSARGRRNRLGFQLALVRRRQDARDDRSHIAGSRRSQLPAGRSRTHAGQGVSRARRRFARGKPRTAGCRARRCDPPRAVGPAAQRLRRL
jgi:alpha,alpha-trehalase